MTPETFFYTDDSGHRHYGRDIARRRRTRPLWLLAAIAGVAGFIAANEWHTVVMGDNVLAYVAVYGGAGLCIWRFVATNALIREFDRHWAYQQGDIERAAASAPLLDEATTQQPHGYDGEERGI